MKILMTLFDAMDPGGICQDLHWKILGLEEAGHTVDIVMLHNGDADPYTRGRTKRAGATEGPNGLQPHPLGGFFGVKMVGYGSKRRMRKLHARFGKYDGIIHEIPGPEPVKTKDHKGRWREIYAHDVPQIISAHDANFRKLYPHLIEIADKIKGISCTNQAGYRALEWFPAPRAFIGAPHPVYDWDKQRAWNERKKRAVSAHVWKAWKHHDQQVRAIPHLKNTRFIMCGSGIEYHYMTSATKRREKYGRIWEAAINAGMDYRGMLTVPELHKLYRNSRVMVDTAWSKRFMQMGSHFNRSIIEGYNCGIVPVVVRENMVEDGFQLRMFREGKTHLALPANHRPKELAQLIDHAANLSPSEADDIVHAGRKVLRRFFDYRRTSLEYLKLLKGRPAGVYPKLETGKLNAAIKEAAAKHLSKVRAPQNEA